MRRLFGIIPLCLIAAALTMTGCSHPQAAAPSPAAVTPPPPATSAAVPPAAPFQPYALINQPPPKPKVATHRNEVLRLTHRAGQVYLTDSEGHLYRCGRDRQGHVFPIYQDPATRVTYPLYYDRSRDRLYRLARNDDGHYYRGYVGDPDNRFYRDDPDYERISPEERDHPIVTDSDNRYNYNYYSSYPSRPGYQVSEGTYYPTPYSPPTAHHGSHANTNWLWAIPVIVVAYLLLNPHHHSSPPAPPQGTVIVQRHNPPTIINRTNSVVNTVINRTNNTVINRTSNVVINRPVPGGYPMSHPAPVLPMPRPAALAHPPSPQHPVTPMRPRAAALVVPALVAGHHMARPQPRPRPVVAHHAPTILPARPHAATLVTPALRPTHHAAKPLPPPSPVHPAVRRAAIRHMMIPPTHRPSPAIAAASRHPQRPRQVSAPHPRLIVAPHSSLPRPRIAARPHLAPQPIRARPLMVRHAPPAVLSRPRPVRRPHLAPQPMRPQGHPPTRSMSAPPVVHRSRAAAPSHPAAVQLRRADRPRPSPRPAPHPANHPRPVPHPAPKPGAGPAGKKK